MKRTDVEALCDEMIAFKKQHDKLYRNSGFICVNYPESIHVTPELLKQIPGEMEKQLHYNGNYWEFSKKYHNARFFAIENDENADEMDPMQMR